jgi:RHS repeat-associated protein
VMGTYAGRMLSEQPVYGSSRLGTYRGGSHKLMRRQGTKNFELSNHLGNVLSVITDNLRMATDSTWADVVNANDYYAFGMSMPGRQNVVLATSPSNTSLSLKGFTYGDSDSKVMTDISNNFTMELWVNPTTTHQIDAQSASGTLGLAGQTYVIYPGSVTTTGEAGAGISVGTNGISVYEMATSYAPPILVWSGTVTGWTHIAVVYTNKVPSLYVNGVFKKTGLTSTKTAVHPGFGFMGNPNGNFVGGVDEIRIWNVSRTAAELLAAFNTTVPTNSTSLAAYWPLNEGKGAVVRDASNHGLDHALVNYSAWSATGATVTGTSATDGNEYRYGFNGKEADSQGDEIGGDPSYDFEERIYSPRLGRWLSPDPKANKYAMDSPYMFAGDCPILMIDPDGNEKIIVVGSENRTWKLTFILPGLKQFKRLVSSEEKTTLVMFTAGYTQRQRDRVRRYVEKRGGTFVEVNSANDVVNYINTKSLKNKPSGREKDRVTNVLTYSHGLPNQFAFGYDQGGATEDEYSFNGTHVNKLDPKAFAPKSSWYSYACRTGASNDNNGDVDPVNSLAQKIANQTGVTVYALQRRSEYSFILPADTRSTWEKMKEKVGYEDGDQTYDPDGGSWDTDSAIDKTSFPIEGSTPDKSPGWTVFKKGQAPSKYRE